MKRPYFASRNHLRRCSLVTVSAGLEVCTPVVARAFRPAAAMTDAAITTTPTIVFAPFVSLIVFSLVTRPTRPVDGSDNSGRSRPLSDPDRAAATDPCTRVFPERDRRKEATDDAP